VRTSSKVIAFASLDFAMGRVIGIGALEAVGVPDCDVVALLLVAELLFEEGSFHCCHTSFPPIFTQIYLTLGASPKLPTLEQVPPSLGVAALA
jgi:hypothetical protein